MSWRAKKIIAEPVNQQLITSNVTQYLSYYCYKTRVGWVRLTVLAVHQGRHSVDWARQVYFFKRGSGCPARAEERVVVNKDPFQLSQVIFMTRRKGWNGFFFSNKSLNTCLLFHLRLSKLDQSLDLFVPRRHSGTSTLVTYKTIQMFSNKIHVW